MGRLFPLLILIAALGLFFGYAQPAFTNNIATLRAKIASYDNALAAAETFRVNQAELLRQQQEVPEEARARIARFLPDGVDNVQLIVDLNALANRSGIRLSDFDVEQPDDEETNNSDGNIAAQGPVDSLDITVSGIGTYAAFRTFLEGVEYALRPMDLIDLSIVDSETGVYTYDMTFRIYWLR